MKGNKFFKTIKFTVAEIDTIDEWLNATSKVIEEHGGTVVGITSPATFGVKPIYLVYTLIYTAKNEISGITENTEETERSMNGDDNSSEA